jgi:hypothetical protein
MAHRLRGILGSVLLRGGGEIVLDDFRKTLNKELISIKFSTQTNGFIESLRKCTG